MDETKTKHNQKLITFPDPLLKAANKKAKKIGLSFSEYMRMLVFLDNRADFEEYEILDKETSKGVEQGMKDIKEGRFVTIEPGQDIAEFLDKL